MCKTNGCNGKCASNKEYCGRLTCTHLNKQSASLICWKCGGKTTKGRYCHGCVSTCVRCACLGCGKTFPSHINSATMCFECDMDRIPITDVKISDEVQARVGTNW